MSIAVGDQVPQVTLKVMGEKGPQDAPTAELLGTGKVVLFAVPGAFTPGCSMSHLPGYVALADKIKERGVDHIVCLSVNDAYVMDAWGKDKNATSLVMAADGMAEFTRAVGMELDATAFGLGVRSKRYALVIEDGVVRHVGLEPDGVGISVSSAEEILKQL